MLKSSYRRRPMKMIVHTLPALVHFTALLALPFSQPQLRNLQVLADALCVAPNRKTLACLQRRSEEHTSELQSQSNLVCRLLLEKKKTQRATSRNHRDT